MEPRTKTSTPQKQVKIDKKRPARGPAASGRRPQFRPRRDARSVNNKQGLAGWLAGWRAGWLAGLGCVDVDVAFGSEINKGWLAGWLAGWLGWL